jgi:type II secretory pathway pseudopilin PulG
MPKNYRHFLSKFSNEKGLTLIEILVTSSLIVFMTTLLLRNFSTTRLNLNNLANVVASDIRLAQQVALSSHQFQGPADPAPRNRCGYGFTRPATGGSEGNPAASREAECSNNVDDDGDSLIDSFDPGCSRLYYIYAGPPTVRPDGSAGVCGSTNYQASQDYPYYKTVVLDKRVDFLDSPPSKDVFYMPPGPTTFIQNSSTPSNVADPTTYYEVIGIKKSSVTRQQCNAGNMDCVYICVYFSGRVEVVNNTTNSVKCPAPY